MGSVRSHLPLLLPPVLPPALPPVLPSALPPILPLSRPPSILSNHSFHRSSNLQPIPLPNLEPNHPSPHFSELPPNPFSNPEPNRPSPHSSGLQPDLSFNRQSNHSPALPSLAPRPASSSLSPSREIVSKRKAALAACDRCRKRKIKCDADRPACGSCVTNGKVCNYYTKPSESRTDALKRKHIELMESRESDATVLEMLRHSRPEDTPQLVDRIRQSQDSHSIVQDMRNSALLLQLSGGPSVEVPGSYTAASPDDSADASESNYYTY